NLGDVVCLEVFDDVGIERADGTRVAEQNKSNLSHNPLSDRSVDLWKTFGSWVDACLCEKLDPDRTIFEIYTSNPAGGNIARAFHAAKTDQEALEAVVAAERSLM